MQFKEHLVAPEPEKEPELKPQPETLSSSQESALAALKEINPEIAAFTPIQKTREGKMHTVGGILFIDADNAAKRHGVEPEKLAPINISERGDIASALSKPTSDLYAKILRPHLHAFGLTEKQARTVEIRPVGRRMIDMHIKNLVRTMKNRTEEDATRNEASENLADLLLGSPKDALTPLRRFLIARLMKQGEIGRTIWENLAARATEKLHRLLGAEAAKIHLPRTLKDAQKHYTAKLG